MNNKLLVKLICVLTCTNGALIGSFALAQTASNPNQNPGTPPYVSPSNAPEPNDISSATSADSLTSVFVGGTSIMRVRFASGRYTAHERAQSIQLRVNHLLGLGQITPDDITVQQVDNVDAAVYCKGQLLFTADKATANYNMTTPLALAQSWASTMRRVLPNLTKPA